MGVVVEPGVSPEIAGLLRANAPLLSRIRSGWVPPAGAPAERPRRSPSSVILLAITPVIIALMAVLLETAMAPVGFVLLGTFVFVVLIKIASINEVPVNHRPHERDVYEHARRHDGRYFLPEDFDEQAGQVLRRAQRAIGTVLRSHVNAEGLLDDARNAVMLPEQEWEIARLLAKLSMLRAEHRDLIDRGIAPEVAAVVRPLQNALDVSEAAVVARVEALERYAGHVAEAERAYHARGQIEALRARLPHYEELLAESGADALAVPEIERLAQDADDVERTLRRSVSSAHEAFRYLEG
ncbi:hypothetical protein LDL08_17185 [Nonomuraea glycinis]|uniref:Uncharacterized protein n=1 Tax=Nonomuraea glycinis TaxID=2047744 RepID=A0A918E5M8_9ACTN|nr:hypothetical protein [Nonomuraea glycinis]MCA2177927.1 hypothetical protein [Nonomuraea glycinis]GGP06401.1 hypothetical protein GCM10012278_29870 [Nonomuraea glycinis]